MKERQKMKGEKRTIKINPKLLQNNSKNTRIEIIP